MTTTDTKTALYTRSTRRQKWLVSVLASRSEAWGAADRLTDPTAHMWLHGVPAPTTESELTIP